MESKPRIANPWDMRQLVVDTVIAVALTVLVWIQITLPRHVFFVRLPARESFEMFPRPNMPFAAAFLLVAACFLPLALRRRYPLTILMVVSAFVSLYALLPLPLAITQVAVLVALFTVGSMVERRRLAPWALAAAAIVLVTAVPPYTSLMFWPDLVRTMALMFGAVAIGDATRTQRAYVVQAEQRAIEAERMREEETSRRIDEERLSIARELHDITAHSLSIVAVQSGAALHVLDSDPAAARTALEAIRDTSRSALTELRGMLGVLRGATEAGGALPLAPTPGLSRIDEIVRPLQEAGVEVALDVDTGADPIPAIVDAGAFRIIQEALTNVLRHAKGSRVRVSARREGDTLSIEVVDDGAGASLPTGEGHGIAGMRERAVALGGTFGAGPAPEGGWWVFAKIPLQGRGA